MRSEDQINVAAESATPLKLRDRNRIVAGGVIGVVAAMLALVAVSAPLYRLFCQATGFGGAIRVAAAAPGAVALASEDVRFDTNVAPGLPWRFAPPQLVTTRLGAEQTVVFEVSNLSGAPTLGAATYNVTPLSAGRFFNKIQCFCFTEQVLKPGATRQLPVTFFVEPAMAAEAEMRGVRAITLSYTFFNKGPASLEKYLRAHPISASRSAEVQQCDFSPPTSSRHRSACVLDFQRRFADGFRGRRHFVPVTVRPAAGAWLYLLRFRERAQRFARRVDAAVPGAFS